MSALFAVFLAVLPVAIPLPIATVDQICSMSAQCQRPPLSVTRPLRNLLGMVYDERLLLLVPNCRGMVLPQLC